MSRGDRRRQVVQRQIAASEQQHRRIRELESRITEMQRISEVGILQTQERSSESTVDSSTVAAKSIEIDRLKNE
ncbi:hypothetical protein FOZ62_007560, partial [Perkinsus olseni]